MERYKKEVEELMVKLFNSLSEKDRRRYAALEVRRLGHGGVKYIMEALGCDDRTIKKGFQELGLGPSFNPRIRNKGGGRKKALDTIKDIDEIFLEVLKNHTAGDPMKEDFFRSF